MGSLMSNEEVAKALAEMLRIEVQDVLNAVQLSVVKEGRSEDKVWDDVAEIRRELILRVHRNVARNWFEQIKHRCDGDRVTAMELLNSGRVSILLEVVKKEKF